MADIAAIFHWSKESLEAMEIDELAGWRQRAYERSPAASGDES